MLCFSHFQINLERVKERRKKRKEIILASKKRMAFKSKAASKKIAKVKLKNKGDGEGLCRWFDLEVFSLIAFQKEMDLEFVRDCKKTRYFVES